MAAQQEEKCSDKPSHHCQQPCQGNVEEELDLQRLWTGAESSVANKNVMILQQLITMLRAKGTTPHKVKPGSSFLCSRQSQRLRQLPVPPASTEPCFLYTLSWQFAFLQVHPCFSLYRYIGPLFVGPCQKPELLHLALRSQHCFLQLWPVAHMCPNVMHVKCENAI